MTAPTRELIEIAKKYFSQQEEIDMTHNDNVVPQSLPEFHDVVSVDVQLIHGIPAANYTESKLLSLISKAQLERRDIKSYAKISKRMANRRAELKTAIAVYVKALDALDQN